MIYIDGTPYPTIADAAPALGVSTRAVRDYIAKEIIDPPPTVSYGLRDIDIFPPDYLERAIHQVAEYRAEKRNRRKKSDRAANKSPRGAT